MLLNCRNERRPEDSRLGDDGRDEVVRRHIEGRVPDGDSLRGRRNAADMGDLFRFPFLDGDRVAIGKRGIDRGKGGGDVKRDPVGARQDGQGVGPDLVGRVAVGGDPVGADDDQIDLSLLHEKSRHVVRDQRAGDLFLHHFPGGQSRPLEDGAGFIDIDMELFAFLPGGTDHAEGRPVTGRGERPGVAVGEDPGAVGDQIPTVRAETAVDGDVLFADPDGLRNEGFANLSPGIAPLFRRNRLRMFNGGDGPAGRRKETGGGSVGIPAATFSGCRLRISNRS